MSLPFLPASSKSRALLRPLVLAAGLVLGAAAPAGVWAQAAAGTAAAPAASVRPEMAKPLAAAQEALRAGNYRDALARLAEAEAVPTPSPTESHLLRRMKAPALYGAGELAASIGVFEGLIDDPLLAVPDRPLMLETVVKGAIQLKDYPRAAKWLKVYVEANGPDAELRRLYPQVLSVTGDHAGAAAGFKAQVAAEDAAGRAPSEQLLRLLASSQGQAKDDAGYLATLQRLAAQTGKTDYWAELIDRTLRRPGFAQERLMLDVYRLRQAVGVPLSAGDLGDMAQRAYQAGLPAEAQRLLDDGFGRNLLGKDANAAADRKLREQATKAAAQERATLAETEASLRTAKDGNAAYGLGLSLSGAGQHDKALALIAQGQAKGGLRRPDEAMLHLGVAQVRAGQTDQALKSFASVAGQDGAADLARLWTAHLKSPARK